MSSRNWEKPLEFNPERFNESQYPKFMPFALGPRNCIGQFMAKQEMRN